MSASTGSGARVAIDIGGTFTDLAAVSGDGKLVLSKVLTTPHRLHEGVLEAVGSSGLEPSDVVTFVHGTTVVINAVTERTGARTALLTTRGFRDVLEIGRADRPDLYNLAYAKPEPFVPRRLRFEVSERMSYHGEVLTPLVVDELPGIAAALRSAGVEALAICFLHAWADGSHEQQAARWLSAALPEVEIVASHEVSSEWREFERSSTTVLSAFVKPVVTRYLEGLEGALREAGVAGPLYAMRSSGGVGSFARARSAPISLLESGPVAGVTAAAELGRRLGVNEVLALDIGGTTAKTSAIRHGRVRISTLHHVERTPASSGYPIQAPVAEIVEIGAGGGSIAWVDEAGGLHVGPRSAGAEPGPACYGRGGTEPTLTDANLVAGRLDPSYFLGGTMPLDPDAARRALAGLGERLGVDASAAARGVLLYAVAQMAHALRLVTVRRGLDPRDFTFVAYGGAGPLHAALLARELGVSRTLIPPAPGHFSAFGMLLGEFRADAVRTHLGAPDPVSMAPGFEALEQEASAELEAEAGERRVERFAQLRYLGQEHSLEVALPPGPVDDALLERLRTDLDRASKEHYAFSLPESPIEVVALRVSVTASAGDVGWVHDGARTGARLVPRAVDFAEHGGVRTAEVIERSEIDERTVLAGPCVVEEPATTILVLPGQRLRADGLGNLLIEEVSA